MSSKSGGEISHGKNRKISVVKLTAEIFLWLLGHISSFLLHDPGKDIPHINLLVPSG
jgi:hypothetical protein